MNRLGIVSPVADRWVPNPDLHSWNLVLRFFFGTLYELWYLLDNS